MIARGRRARIGAAFAAALLTTSLLQVSSPASAATPTVQREAGGDRYATSAQISATTFAPGVGAVYIASGATFPDALAGAAAAGGDGAPVLLTAPGGLPAVISAEISRLRPARVVVLGGEGAVSPVVLEQIARVTSAPLTRVAGADRFETATEISAATHPDGASVVYLASGELFPDALSAGSVAGAQDAPILLTPASALPDVVRREIARLGPQRIVVIGGSGAVSESVAAEAASTVGARLERRSGRERYATSAAISAAAFVSGAPTVYLASGSDFPDALSGAAAARGAPVLLTAPGSLPAVIAAEIARLRPQRIVVLGGSGAVSPAVFDRLAIVGSDLAQASGGRITRETEVRTGTCLASADATHALCVRSDVGFGVYRGQTALWTSSTPDSNLRSLRVRADGSAALYTGDGRVVWESSTSGTTANELVVQNDGDLMLRGPGNAIVWSSMSSAATPQWRMPFASGQSWAVGGPHANSGNTPGARGSLDLGPRAGGDRQVLAIADGTVYRVQCGTGSYLGIAHANGWQSTYYHLVDYQDQLVGRFVTAGTYLGTVGRTVPCGGGATFDHVHLTIRRGGAPVSVEGVTFGGYTVHSSGRDYWGYWTNASGQRVLTAPGGAACCLTAQ